MTGFSSISRTDLNQRRRDLRRQRRVRGLQSGWRVVAVSGLTAGLVWVSTLPSWVIRQPDQVEIEGNQLLTTEAIQALLPLEYPQSLLQVRPQALVQALETKAPIAEATVTRHLFPPRLTVQVKERQPVAVAILDIPASKTAGTPGLATGKTSKTGLLDASGKWMSLESYAAVKKAFKLPSLKVLGMRSEHAPYWAELYPIISRSPVKILEIDWRNPTNLILKTELGVVHVGPYSSSFAAQVSTIDQMRKLPQHLKSTQIAYIDLRNPTAPAVQVLKSKQPVKPNTL